MASPHFPFSHIPSEISFSPLRETKGHPPTMRTTDVRRCLKGTHTDMADPQVASCIRFDHRQAIHLLQHRSSTSHKDGSRLQRQTKEKPSGRSPFEQASRVAGLIDSIKGNPVVHRRGLLERRANQVRSKPLFNL